MVATFKEIMRFSEHLSNQITTNAKRVKHFGDRWVTLLGETIESKIGRVNNQEQHKILFVANTGWYLYNFRLPLAKFLRLQGIDVVLVSPWDSYVEKLQAEGFRWIKLQLNRRSVNPLLELFTVVHLTSIYLQEKPSVVHHFTIKCVLYGTFAAQLCNVRAVVNSIEGLGYIFSSQERKAKVLQLLIKPFYKLALTAKRVRVVLLNLDDLRTLRELKLVEVDRTILIKSSGIDLKRFSPCSNQLDVPLATASAPIVVFASRLTTEKGVSEYVEAARILKDRGVNATFQIVGAPDPGNPSSISQSTLENWRNQEIVDLLGHVDDIENLIAPSMVVVLPSHGGEGVPRILLEAAAMGKPLVATDVPGCRDVIEHGKNGFLVPVKDAAQLADAIEVLLENPELCQTMGTVGRKKVLREFDVQEVIRKTVGVYELMGVRNLTPVPMAVSHRS